MIYFDHAASAPLSETAREAWLRASAQFGNASSVHHVGQSARRILEDAREELAETLGCEAIEIVFTSGGTESINTALKGLWRTREENTKRIVLPEGEHHATLETVQSLEKFEGAEATLIPLQADGQIATDAFAQGLNEAALATALVANNEVGTINPIEALCELAATTRVPLHLDAVAAFGQIALNFRQLRGVASGNSGLVTMSISGHKIGAPVGSGALVLSRHSKIEPLINGGAAQRGVRGGTQDIAAAAALAAAASEAHQKLEHNNKQLEQLQAQLISGIKQAVPEAQILGADNRLANNVHVHIPGVLGETLLFLLDTYGIALSTGSACQAGVAEPSHVVMAMGFTPRQAREVIRISLGASNTQTEIERFLALLPDAARRAKAASLSA